MVLTPAPVGLARVAGALLLMFLLSGLLPGCGGEHTVPVPVEAVGPVVEPAESMALDLDARGYVNGIMQPGNRDAHGHFPYPVSYTGTWDVFLAGSRQGWYMAKGNQPGAEVNVVGTMTRVIFDFWDYRQYDNPGRVSFWLDGAKKAEFDLARSNAIGQGINDYIVYTNKTTVSTVTMRIESGRAVLAGYRFIFPPLATTP